MPSTSLRLWLGIAGLAAGGFSGCATLQLPWDKNRVPQASSQNPAVRIVCLWEQAEGRDPDGLPCRGFAGQILFLANRNAMPVKVQGDVRIYLFDDVGTPDDQSKPLRQFDFTSDAWQVHLTKSAIGPSYSVFVPYVRRGRHNAQCSLRVRLTPKDGPVIFSEVAALPLRGPETSSETTLISEPMTAMQATPKAANTPLSSVQQKTTTFPLVNSNSGALALANARPEQQPKPTSSPEDDRLSRVEQLLQKVLAERSASALPASDSNGIEQASYETPASDEESSSRRFRLDQRED